MPSRPNMPARRRASTMRPATAFCSSLRQASAWKSAARSTAHRLPCSAWATPRAAGTSGRLRRASPRRRTEPSAWACAGNHTTAGTICPRGQCGATCASCSTPFCSTHTTVSGPLKAASQGAAASTCVTLTARKTRSQGRSMPWRSARAGSVQTGPGTVTRRSPSCSVSWARTVRPHSSGVRPTSCSAAATVVPMAPGPTTAMESGGAVLMETGSLEKDSVPAPPQGRPAPSRQRARASTTAWRARPQSSRVSAPPRHRRMPSGGTRSVEKA